MFTYTWERGTWRQSGVNTPTVPSPSANFTAASVIVSFDLVDGGLFGYPGLGDDLNGGIF